MNVNRPIPSATVADHFEGTAVGVATTTASEELEMNVAGSDGQPDDVPYPFLKPGVDKTYRFTAKLKDERRWTE